MTLIPTVVDSEKYRVQHQLHYSSQVGHDNTPVRPHSAGYQCKQIRLSRIFPEHQAYKIKHCDIHHRVTSGLSLRKTSGTHREEG